MNRPRLGSQPFPFIWSESWEPRNGDREETTANKGCEIKQVTPGASSPGELWKPGQNRHFGIISPRT
jgi:hypothetical protein